MVEVVVLRRGKSNDLRRTVNHPAAAAAVVQPVAVVTRYTGTTVILFITITRNIVRSMFAGAPPPAAELGRRGRRRYHGVHTNTGGRVVTSPAPADLFLARDGFFFFFLPRRPPPHPFRCAATGGGGGGTIVSIITHYLYRIILYTFARCVMRSGCAPDFHLPDCRQ